MRAPSIVRPRAPLPWALLAAIGVVVATESTLSRHARDVTTMGAAYFQFARRACQDASKYELLCFGDSQNKLGLVPRVLEARSGLSAFNLSIAGGSSPTTYYVFRRALDAGARPSALVVDYNPTLLHAPPRGKYEVFAEILDVHDAFEYAWTVGRAWIFAQLAIDRLVPSVRYRFALRSRIVMKLAGRRLPDDHILPVFRRNWSVNLGSEVVPGTKDAPPAVYWDEEANCQAELPGDISNLVYLKKFLTLAARRRIPVYWLLPPLHPRVQAKRDRLGLDSDWTGFLLKVQKRYPGLVILDARQSGFEADSFNDATHLNIKGAAVLSASIGDVVRSRRGGSSGLPRWAPLTRSGVAPPPRLHEDLLESAVALDRVEETRRR